MCGKDCHNRDFCWWCKYRKEVLFLWGTFWYLIWYTTSVYLVFSVVWGILFADSKQWSSSLELRKRVSLGVAWATRLFSLMAFILETFWNASALCVAWCSDA